MRSVGLSLLVVLLCCAFEPPPQMESLGPKDTFSSARLSPKEAREIVHAVEQTSYDWPDSWKVELRLRRVNLGSSPGIIAEGSKLLCGATGNCQIWVFRKVHNRWMSLFGNGQAPLAEGFELGPTVTNGIKDLTVVSNLSAESGERRTYKFDGKVYRAEKSDQSGFSRPGSIESIWLSRAPASNSRKQFFNYE